jgi:hypothetical protein
VIRVDDAGDGDGVISHHVIFRELVLNSAGASQCLATGGLDDFRIEEIEVTACRTGVRLIGSHHGVVASNWFHDTLGPALAIEGGADDVVVHGNWFESIPSRAVYAGGLSAESAFRPPGEVFEARGVRTVANVFVEIGMGTDGGVMAFVGCVDCVFAHNTFHLGRPYVIRILEENPEPRLLPSRNGVVANNIMVFDSRDLVRVVNVDSDPTSVEDETFSFRNNLYSAVDDPMFMGPNFGTELRGDDPAGDGADREHGSALHHADQRLHAAAGKPRDPLGRGRAGDGVRRLRRPVLRRSAFTGRVRGGVSRA